MKPQQLAAILNIASSTLRTWAGKEYAEFLSPNAAGINGAHRSYDDRDSRILAWVATMRATNMPLTDISATLRSAQADNWRNLPPMPGGMANDEPIAVIPREAAEERLTAIEERFEMQLQAAFKERDELRERMAEMRTDNERLRQQLFEANQQIVELSKELTSLVRQRREPTKK